MSRKRLERSQGVPSNRPCAASSEESQEACEEEERAREQQDKRRGLLPLRLHGLGTHDSQLCSKCIVLFT